jgi:acetate---CoA ligase (ADP-forming)
MSQSPAPSGRSSLERLLNPRSIALVGATERSIWAIAAAENLKRCEFDGAIHMVNPKGGTVFGRAAATSCAAIGEPVDAALLMVPESKILAVFEDLRAARVGGVVILSSGFAETGEDGAERQRRMAAAAREADIRIIGPNCLGFANFAARTAIWTTPLRRQAPGGRVAIASQSGALAAQLEQFAYQQRIGLTHMISTGNEADVTIADAVEFLAAQPEPRAIALFLESVRDPARFERAVRAANAAGKTVVALKVGTSEATARAAQAHTGSLVGNDRVFDALCRRLAIARVHSLEELMVTADLASRLPALETPTLALVAMSGGLCEIATDQAEHEGVTLAALAPPTLAALREVLPPLATPNNPLDVTGAMMLEPALVERSLAAIGADPGVGAIAWVFDAPPKDDAQGFARTLMTHGAAGFEAAGKPGLMVSHTFMPVTAEGRAMAEELGLPYSGAGVRLALSALGHLFRRQQSLQQAAPPADPLPPATARPRSEREVLAHLAAHGVPVIPAQLATSRATAIDAARALEGPVVLKILSPDIAHKTEVGGVALNLSGDEAVGAAYDAMLASVKRQAPNARIEGITVSPMRRGGIELFVGTLRDPQWGPCIAVGLGGIFVEVLEDTSLRLLPIRESDALEMLGELRGSRLLDGFRGQAAVDRRALARVIVRIGDAALALGSDLLSLEVNPLVFDGRRIEALDGVAEWSSAHA